MILILVPFNLVEISFNIKHKNRDLSIVFKIKTSDV